MRYEQVKYKLIDNDRKVFIWLENDPQNWNESEKTIKRSTKTYGVYTELSKDLIFVKDGADFLKLAYFYKDIEADVTLEEYRHHPNTDAPYLHSTGVFDFSEYKEDKLTVKVPFKSGGLNALIKSQEREKFELERLDAINGNAINPIDKKTVALTSRKILLVSSFELTNERSESFTASGQLRTILTNVVANSDQANIGFVTSEFIPFVLDGNFGGDDLNPDANQFFYYNSDVAKELNIQISFDAYINTSNGSTFDAYILQRDVNDNTVEFRRISPDTTYTVGLFNYSVDANENFDLSEGDSLMVVINAIGNTAGSTRINYIEYTNFNFVITEDSIRDDSQTEAVLLHDAGDKLMQIITGEQNRFKSDFYSTGEFKLTALTLGFWIRQFYYNIEVVDDEELPKYGMQMSFDNLIKTSNTIHNTGYTIEVINDKETLVLEDMRYFFQDAIAIRLPNQVTNLKREAYKELCDSSLEFGYKKGGDYEEAMGLDEYNIKTGFTTPLIKVETKYSKISDARSDSYAKEFARRKPKLNYPTTDTPYDKDLHLLDLKEGLGLALEERIWSDDFEELPKGVYSPETATNLRLTPSQLERRHQWFYGCGLTKQRDKKIRYSNTEGNNSLSTKKTGESARSERQDISINDIERPRFINQKITFEHPLDYFINEQLNGKTNVDGRLIPNWFFKVEFINEYNQKETGYLMELKPNKEGKWTILKSN